MKLLATLLLAMAIALPLQVATANDVIGELQQVTLGEKDTIPQVAKVFSIGLNEIEIANSHLQRWLPGSGAVLLLPTRYVLPDTKREGIVVNIPEMRIYYFRKGEVHTWPVGVGREGWNIPYKSGTVIARHKDPAWYPPKSIREEHAAEGDPLPRVVPPGPDNPLGKFALRLSLPGYLIHGTNKEYGIGMRVSHGCIRMYPNDIAELYAMTPTGTPFHIINQPLKLGIQGQRIYLEVHPYMVEDQVPYEIMVQQVQQRIYALTSGNYAGLDWNLINHSLRQPTGVPVAIGLMAQQQQPGSAATE